MHRHRGVIFCAVPARFVAVLPSAERKVSNPASRIRAIVHWTIAFRYSNLSGTDFSKKKTHTIWCAFSFWRYRPDLNWRITVLQTGALPLGYGTIYKSGTRGYVPDLFGAGDEVRTRYLHLGKVALYRMSYTRKFGADRRNRITSIPNSQSLVPPVGIEPTTRGFSVRCSTY